MSSAAVWQNPNVNIFKRFAVGKWKQCSKEGDVTTHMDRDIKATVFRICGSIPANNFILVPKTSTQSLNLVGGFFYLIFKPLPSKHFVVHLEVVTSGSVVIRISFSNLFREFKSTSTWLQFPYKYDPGAGDDNTIGVPEKGDPVLIKTRRWTFLSLNLKEIISKYLFCKYSYLKNIKLCANILVKSAFTSDLEYSPLVSSHEGGQMFLPLPKEMSLPLARGSNFLDVYNYVCFPCGEEKSAMIFNKDRKQLKGMRTGMLVNFVPDYEGRDPLHVRNVTEQIEPRKPGDHVTRGGDYHVIRESKRSPDRAKRVGDFDKLADHSIVADKGKEIKNRLRKSRTATREKDKDEGKIDTDSEEGEVHVYAEQGAEVTVHPQDSNSKRKKITISQSEPKTLQPDPIMELHKVIGFGGATTDQALFGAGGETVVYPCHSLVVAMDVVTGQQRFFTGHNNKVSCLSFDLDRSLLASGQAGSPAAVRVWDIESGRCLALFQTHDRGIHSLSFSAHGSLLCGVGKDRLGRTLVVMWDTSQLRRFGEVSVLTKAHTGVSIEKMRVASFDETRMVSCGWNNVRFWRLRGNILRSCPLNLQEHHQKHFTDIQLQPGYHTDSDLSDRNVYASTESGHLFEIHYKRLVITRVWELLPNVSILSLSLHEAFCAMGSDDGILRVWPLDFSAIFMEAEHQGEVTAVDISGDGLKILAGTSAGNLGILDASAQIYSTLMRSHGGHVTSMSVSHHSPGHVITCSSDRTIRVWNLPDGTQTFDFRAFEDCATCVCAGPKGNIFASGFTSGAVRVFKLPSTKMVAEYRYHSGAVTGLVYSPFGHLLYSSSSVGSLALYSNQENHTSKLLRLLSNIVAKGEDYAPKALALNEDGSRLAFVGPLNFTITVLEGETLNEVLRLDITPVTSAPNQLEPFVDAAKIVSFSPNALNQILVVTKQARLLRFSSSDGQLLSEVTHLHRKSCSSLSVSANGRYLLTAGNQILKVWDYNMAMDVNFQVFIGHTGTISESIFTFDNHHVISCGDALFIWNFNGVVPPSSRIRHSPPSSSSFPLSTPSKSSSSSQVMVAGPQSASPRKRVPTPASYDPLKMQTFTPIASSPRISAKNSEVDVSCVSSSKCEGVLDVDDDRLYESHQKKAEEEDGEEKERNLKEKESAEGRSVVSVSQERVEMSQASTNINRFRNRVASEVTSEDGTDEVHVILEEEEKEIEEEEEEEEEEGSVVNTPDFQPPPVVPDSTSPSLSPPSALTHLLLHVPRSGLACRLYHAPKEEQGIRRRAVCGISNLARNNVAWQPSSGLFMFSSGSLVVLEDLSKGTQSHFEGHVEEVTTLALQHSGNIIASASTASSYTACEIRIWTISSAKCTKVLRFHSNVVQSMDYSPDDRLLLSIGNYQDGSLALWSTWDYSLLVATSLSSPIHAHCWDPCTAYEFATVGAGQQGGRISFWMVVEDMGGKKHQLKVHDPVIPKDLLQTKTGSSLEFTSICYGNEPLVFVGSINGVISMWETRQNVCLLFWKTEPCEISCMLASEGKLLVGNTSGSLQLWAVDSSTTPPTVMFHSNMDIDNGAIFSANFNSKMDQGVVGSSSGVAWYINWKELNKLKLIGGHGNEITSVAFSSDSSLLASSSLDGSFSVLRLETREQLVLFQAPKKACFSVAFAPMSGSKETKEGTGVQRSSMCPDVAAGYSDGTVRIFDIGEGRMIKKMQPHAKPVRAVAYTIDGRVIISGCSAGLVAVSNLSSGLVVQMIADHQGAPITDLQVAPKPIQLPCLGEEQCFLWLVASGDRRVSLWSCNWQRESCQLVDWLTFPGPSLTPDGTSLHKGSKCQYKLLPPSLARFSPADPDTILYTGYGLERTVQFYSISRKTVFRKSSLTHWPTCFAVSPLSHLLTFGCHERVLKLMDYEEGSFQDFTGHHDSVGSLAFSPCGKFLVSSSQSVIHIWDVLY